MSETANRWEDDAAGGAKEWRTVTDVAAVAVDRKLALAVFPLSITDTGSIPAQNPGNISFVKFKETPNVISNRRVSVLAYFQIRGRECAVAWVSRRAVSTRIRETGVPWTIGDVPDVKIHNGKRW